MCPQGIDQLGPLPHQQIAYSMLHQPALLLDRLDHNEPHGWAPDRFADRLGVGGIVLVALDVGLHILRRHQTNLVAELRQFTRPIMCRGAGFHADKTRRQNLEELYQLAAAKLLSDDDLLCRIDAVNLEHVLGDIQTDRGNLHVVGSSPVIRPTNHPMAPRCRERAPSTTSIAAVPTNLFPCQPRLPRRREKASRMLTIAPVPSSGGTYSDHAHGDALAC